MIKKLLKEPLIHFAFIGIALFILFSFVNSDDGDHQIIVDEYDLNEIIAKWNLQWRRDPTPQELKGLLDGYIKEEIMYREALTMNLDHNDEIIRRRMAQKMQFLTQDVAERAEPSDEELQSFLDQNQEKYLTEKTISFEHIYFSIDKRQQAKADAQSALEQNNPSGDQSPVRLIFNQARLSRISGELGSEFANTLDTLNVMTQWQGPVQSGFGYHLVKVTETIPKRKFQLSEIRTKVKNDFLYDLENQLNDVLYESLLEKYEVSIELDDERLKTIGD